MSELGYVVRDGKVYASVPLRDIVTLCDVSDEPILSEIKRLYEENDRLREAAEAWMRYCDIYTYACAYCPHRDNGDHTKPCEIVTMLREMGIGNDD